VKYVVVLLLLATLVALVYWRLRPYVRMARRFLNVVRDVRRVGEDRTTDLPQRGGGAREVSGEPLVRCASCGTWLPASRAVRLPASPNAYCSHACLERAADAPRSTRKTAS
jgi:hypothetical protein